MLGGLYQGHTMPDLSMIKKRPRGAPPPIDETKVSQALQDLFASWRAALKEPFKGLTASGEIERGLFSSHKTGASTRPSIEAASTFLASLDPTQRGALRFDVNSETWRTWSNIHRNLMRHGLCLTELKEQQ